LVHCSAGVSRSPALLLGYLARQMQREEAYALLCKQRPLVDISLDHLAQADSAKKK
jgi:predicted protein tyrosine phosphatase